MVHFIYELISD